MSVVVCSLMRYHHSVLPAGLADGETSRRYGQCRLANSDTYNYIYIIVTPSHKTSLNSRLADKRYQLHSLAAGGQSRCDFHFAAIMHS